MKHLSAILLLLAVCTASRLSRAFSSCNCLSSRAWSGSSPAYCFFQRQKVYSLMPSLRHTSATDIPSSTCLSTATICSTEKRLRLTTSPAPRQRGHVAERLTLSVSRFPQCRSRRGRLGTRGNHRVSARLTIAR